MLRMGAQDPWIQARNSHDDNAIQQIREGLATTDETIANAIWWAMVEPGHKPSQAFTPPSHPPTVRLSGCSSRSLFFEGLGHGLGERWGSVRSNPQTRQPSSPGLHLDGLPNRRCPTLARLGRKPEAPQLRRVKAEPQTSQFGKPTCFAGCMSGHYCPSFSGMAHAGQHRAIPHGTNGRGSHRVEIDFGYKQATIWTCSRRDRCRFHLWHNENSSLLFIVDGSFAAKRTLADYATRTDIDLLDSEAQYINKVLAHGRWNRQLTDSWTMELFGK